MVVSGGSAAEVSAILLDAGGVLIFPEPALVLPPLRAAGAAADLATLQRAHYQAMAAQDADAAEPAHGTWWRNYLLCFVAACGVAEARREQLADAIVQQTRTHSYTWTHLGLGALDGLRKVAALGLPLGVVSNSDGTVEDDLRRMGVCYVPDGRPPPAAGIQVGVIVDSAVVGAAKPDPEIFRIALDALGVPAGEKVLHVGDSLRYDVAGARAAGLQPVHMDPHGLCPDPGGHPHVRSLAALAELARPDIGAAFTFRPRWPRDDPGDPARE